MVTVIMDIARSQQQILQQLKARGPRTVKVLARYLDMTPMGARQHLLALQQQGLVTSTVEPRQTRGRPQHLWELTASGHGRFADGHAGLTVKLLNLLDRHLDAGQHRLLLEDLGQQDLDRYHEALQQHGVDLPAMLTGLTKLRCDDGFMAELRMLPGGDWLLIQNHCPVFAAASHCRQLCEGECRFLQQLLASQARVERTELRLEGARRCAYRISRVEQQGTAAPGLV